MHIAISDKPIKLFDHILAVYAKTGFKYPLAVKSILEEEIYLRQLLRKT